MGNNYYVYVYLNQLKSGEWCYNDFIFNYQPFYVGKGRNNREISHLFKSNLNNDKNYHKNNTIKKIFKLLNEEPIHFRLYENLTNDEAIKIEADLIKYFGRTNDGSGILTNMTDGGEGVNNFVDKNISKKWARKKVYQYDLNGNFIREWESIKSVSLPCKQPMNISTTIKKNGTWCDSIWFYEKQEYVKPRIKNQMKITYTNIKQIDKNTGEVIKTFENALEAENELNLRKGARNKIYECLQGKLKTAYKFKWSL